MIPLGSSDCLMFLITCIPVGPYSSSSSVILPRPTPCSPVQVPPTFNALLKHNK